MNVIKRSGMEVLFDKNKIVNAITKAKKDTPTSNITKEAMEEIAEYIEFKCGKLGRAAGIEEIQDMVEQNLMARGEFELAKNYVRYRYKRELIRKKNTTDDKILGLIDCMNEEVTQENANKNTHINSTQRDYIAGEVNRDIVHRLLLPPDLAEADKEGLIHIHDQDYMAMHEINCCLLNLEDMLQNGTVISGTKIDKPHSFSVACNISTQIMAQIASNQYGGQSISLTHLAPFVDVSRQNLKKDVIKEFDDIGFEATEEIINKITEERLMKEISKGIQTIQYQILTLSSVNGQAPFVSIFMYLNEAKNEREKKDLAIIIEEMLKQRIQGVKNAAGQWVTPAFPKLLYVLEPDNISEDQPYWYLTELAAKCTAKRMVPDYISEKIMFENKEGNCYPCMGCLNGSETVTIKLPNGKVYEKESLVNLWQLASSMYGVYQYTEHSQFINCDDNFQIYDTSSNRFVRIKKFIKNDDMGRWNKVEFENGLSIIATSDHPFPTQRGRIKVKDIIVGSDEVQLAKSKNMVKVTDITFLGYRYANEYDVETESDRFDVSGINSHNCRSFLTVWKDENGKPKFYGRENQGVCTINLPDVALSSKKDFNKFWKILDERLEMCKRALMIKHKRLEGTVADYSPIHWMYGGLARLKSGEKIDKYLHGGYSTISLGYAGLYECVKYMTGVSHTDEKIGKPFGLKIMQHLNDKCKEWKQEENIDFSVYGSPEIA